MVEQSNYHGDIEIQISSLFICSMQDNDNTSRVSGHENMVLKQKGFAAKYLPGINVVRISVH